MKKLVVAGMLGLAAFTGLSGIAVSAPLFGSGWSAGAVNSQSASQAPVVRVQQGSEAVRVQQLEEEIRQLNGRIEEMSFQLLQMQEQLRKAQEDNEFRFQELEKSENTKGGRGAATASSSSPSSTAPSNTDEVATIIETPSNNGASTTTSRDIGAAPGETTLGSIQLDSSGMPVGGTLNDSAKNSSGSLPGVEQNNTASVGGAGNGALTSENDIYQAAYGHILSGDYKLAEDGFQSYLKGYPKGGKAADATFWLGEAQYSQGRFNDAAKTFLDAHKNFAKSPRAPEMLLKLGMSLAALDNKDTACATLREVTKRYPSAPKAVLGKVASEQKRLSC
ncbi:tol-pal system protein YbgF [Agrobacterium sp.]|uniref:tol-pal system protein YbgF n=1 Tax=Agrobacterium sp. TaxID=361 RepID=UPI0028AB5CDB